MGVAIVTSLGLAPLVGILGVSGSGLACCGWLGAGWAWGWAGCWWSLEVSCLLYSILVNCMYYCNVWCSLFYIFLLSFEFCMLWNFKMKN